MSKTSRFVIQGVVAIAIVTVGIFGFMSLKASKKGPEREKSKSVPLPIVRTHTITTGALQIEITGQGTVKPVQEIQMVPEVSGKVVEIARSLVNGGSFSKGDILLVIEPADYEIAVVSAEARIKDAQSRYQLAREAAAAARHEWQQLHAGDDPPALVAKEPQLAAALAQLDAERASLEKAQLDLERTRLIAPFNGRVRSEQVDIGQYVVPGQPLATLYATDAAEIVVPLEDRDLGWFDVPGFTTDSGQGAPAEVMARVAGEDVTWAGRVVRSEGTIDEQTRMHNLVIQVDRPYASIPPLAAGQFAEVLIHGRTLAHAAIIPRVALHADDTVWVVDPADSRLHFRKVEVAHAGDKGLVIRKGLSDGDQVVISPLKLVSDGMQVRSIKAGGGESL